MVTGLEIVDSAVKIGLGGVIAALSTYLLTKQKYKYESISRIKDEKKELTVNLAIKIENVEYHSNEAIVNFHNGEQTAAKNALLPASREAYSARAIANILGNSDLVNKLESLSRVIDSLYRAMLHSSQSDISILMRDMENIKKSMYPDIRIAWQNEGMGQRF